MTRPGTPPAADHLQPHECWSLLRTAEVGRLAVAPDGRPDIFPVNFLVDHATVVLRTGEGTKLAPAPHVAFEADGQTAADDGVPLVWSVVLRGPAEEVDGMDDYLRALTLPLAPWQEGSKPRFLRVTPEVISGRRFRRAPRPA